MRSALLKSKGRRFKPAFPIFIAVFLIMLALSSLCVRYIQKSTIETEQVRVRSIAVFHGEEIRRLIDRTCSVDYSLAALVESGNGTVTNFSKIANKLLPYYPGAKSLQLAPDGIISQIVPLEGNEKAIGRNQFTDPARSDEAKATRDSGVLTLAGPYDLVQGGQGFIARLPVFIASGVSEQKFWGFVSAVISLPDALDSINIESIHAAGYSYQLVKAEAGSKQELMVASSQNADLNDPVEWNFTIANTQWILRIEPIGGWIDRKQIALEGGLSILVSLLLAIIVVLIINLRFKKKELEKLASTDFLTGIYNKLSAISYLTKLLERAGKTNERFAICFMDVDKFKHVNDTYGHYSGDLLLSETARRIKENVLPGDFVSRFGGDEFLAILNMTNHTEGLDKAVERISDAMRKPVILDGGTQICVNVSVGTAMYPENGTDVNALIRFADNSMYQVKQKAKESGGCKPELAENFNGFETAHQHS